MQRVLRNAVLILIAMIAGSLIFAGWRLAVSVLVGGVLALANFRWLDRLVAVLFRVAEGGSAPPSSLRVVLSWLARLSLIFGTLFAMIQLSFFRPLGAVCGLSIFVLSGMLEALIFAAQKKV